MSPAIAWLMSMGALLPGQEPAMDAPDVAVSARAVATLEAGGATIGVGTHLVWRVTIDDPERGGVSLPEPKLGPEWAVIAGPTSVLDPSRPKANRPDLDRVWTVMPLAGGTLLTPELTATFGDGAVVTVPAASVEVAPSLGETEEIPRPLLGFRSVPDRRVGDPRAAMLVLGGLFAAVVGLLVWRRVRKRRASILPPDSVETPPLEEIGELDRSELSAALKMAALAPLFRRAIDMQLESAERQRRAALTDEAWAAEIEGSRGDAAKLLMELSAFRYGGGEPTSFAVKDAIARAIQLAADSAVPSHEPEEAA